MCKLGVISQERLKLEVVLLSLLPLIGSRMPRGLVQQRMTLSDLEWPFHGSSVLSGRGVLMSMQCAHRPH